MKAATLLVLLFVVTAVSAQAQSTISEIAVELQDSPVYVGSGFPDVDVTDIGRMESQLFEDDHIVLVLLPSSDYGAFTAEDLAEGLSDELGDQYIVGLALDKEVVAYAPMIPAAVSADLMQRAVGLSNNNPVTALIIFVQNVHKWQAKNPVPTPTPIPTPTPESVEQSADEEGGRSVWPLLGSSAGIIMLVLGAMVWFRAYRKPEMQNSAANRHVETILASIQANAQDVKDWELQSVLEKLVTDTNWYLNDGLISQGELTNLFDRLTDANAIVEQYVKIQNNPQRYRHPREEMASGKKAICSFGDVVHELILQSSDRSLADYRLDKNSLEAEKEAHYL